MGQVPANKKEELRHKAKTDLFFLGKSILNYDFEPRVHGPICDMFVHKDDTKPLAEQDTVKERMILDPRGHFKTTVDVADCIQWILNFPNIRINLMSGTEKLVKRMSYEVQWHFIHNENLHALFPEFCLPENTKITEEFTSPARVKGHLREPTLSISTEDSVKASSHYDVIKCDDLVHENNVGTPDQLQKTIDGFGHTTPILEPYGYRDRIGTRYDYGDLYGWTLDQIDEDKFNALQKIIPFGYTYEDEEIKVICRQVWTTLSDGTKVLLFPERMNLKWLEKYQREHPYLFNCQYMNDPTPTEKPTFTEELLLSHTIPVEQLPQISGGRVFQVWDIGYSQKKFADFSVCTTILFSQNGAAFVIDLDIGRFSPYELAMHIVQNYMRWRPALVGIESAAGAPLLEPTIVTIGQQWNLRVPIDWIKVKNVKGAKEERIGGLHGLLLRNGLFFSAKLPHYDELTKQFIRFPKYKRNDIPDSIALAIENYRNRCDIYIPPNQVEMVSAPTYPGCSMLGAGIIG